MKFTPEEIKVCKELSRLGVRKKRVCGDWVYVEYPPRYANPPQTTGQAALYERLQHSTVPFKIKFNLWQIHDCLEWLKGKGIRIWGLHTQYDEDVKPTGKFVFWCNFNDEVSLTSEYNGMEDALTPLEALLKAMIAIAKDNK